jgi:hypothetical protein
MLREEEYSNKQQSRSSSPKRSPSKSQSTLQKGMFMMTITTISPKNHFKKILALTKDKLLDQRSCNWMHGFYQVKKYKLFSLKTVTCMKLLPEMLSKKKDEDMLKLKSTIFKLKSLYESHIKST